MMADGGSRPIRRPSDEHQLRALHPALASMVYGAESTVSLKRRDDQLPTDPRDSPAALHEVSGPASSSARRSRFPRPGNTAPAPLRHTSPRRVRTVRPPPPYTTQNKQSSSVNRRGRSLC
jgi:hypothetical protein